MLTLKLNMSDSTHHLTPRAHSTGRPSLLRSRFFASLARSSSGIVSKTLRLLPTHFVSLKPQGRASRSLAGSEAFPSVGKDMRQSSTWKLLSVILSCPTESEIRTRW